MLQYIGHCNSLSDRVWQDECGDIVENQTKRKKMEVLGSPDGGLSARGRLCN